MNITPGIHTVQEILDKADITVDDTTDRRGIKIGGLGFDYTDEQIRVVGDTLEVTVDGTVTSTFNVTE